VHVALEALDVPERSTPVSRRSRRTSSRARVRSLAVLPLENLSPGDSDYPRHRKAFRRPGTRRGRRSTSIPNCAEAHAALGWTAAGFDWDWDTAEREFRHAIEVKPQYGPVHIWSHTS
jgi:hypothetical protein